MNCANFNYKWTHENFSLLSSKTGTLQKVCISCSHTQHNLILCFILVFLFEVCFFLFYQKYFSLQDVNFNTSQLGGRKSLNQTRLKEHLYLILFLNVFWHFLDFFFLDILKLEKRRESILKVQDIANFIRLIGDVSDL